MPDFVQIFQHLLPYGRPWHMRVGTQSREFWEGLAPSFDSAVAFIADVYDDVQPDTTTQLDLWEEQFGLSAVGKTEQQRRDAVTAAWRAVGGQSPRYLQDLLQAAGFDVFVHDFWDEDVLPIPATGIGSQFGDGSQFGGVGEQFIRFGAGGLSWHTGDITAQCGRGRRAQCGQPQIQCGRVVDWPDDVGQRKIRPPGIFLDDGVTGPRDPVQRWQCGRWGVYEAQCGRTGVQCGRTLASRGYPLSNNVTEFLLVPAPQIQCGNPGAMCGRREVQCGRYTGLIERKRASNIPLDGYHWPSFAYVGAATFPDKATVPLARREEFENMLVRFFPAGKWIGVMVDYV